MEYVIEMDYIGGILTDNNYKLPTRGTKPFVKRWMRELTSKTVLFKVPKTDAYEVWIHGQFLDERRPDISNLFKVTADAIKKGLGVDDKFFKMVDKGYELGFVDPKLIITIVPLELVGA